jgi:ferredoxin
MPEKLSGDITQDNTRFIESEIYGFVRTSPLNRMPDDAGQVIFDEPMVRFADGNDSLFAQYKDIIAPIHLTPHEALSLAMDLKQEEIPDRLYVISWILPITLKTRKSNRTKKNDPSILWAYTRWYGELFNEALRAYVVKVLTEKGFMAAAPGVGPHFRQERNEKGYYSNWSERHVAYVAGHGTFSLSDGFITDRGIAHRCGSVVTDFMLTASPRAASTPFSNCTFYVDGSCRACIKRCPAGAITEAGHDKIRCRDYQREYFASMRDKLKVGNTGCGLCQTGVPCEFKNPVKN